LARDLGAAIESLKLVEATRKQADDGQQSLAKLLERQGKATTALINATAALTQLSNDGELLRNITMLVGALEVSERMSRHTRSGTFNIGERIKLRIKRFSQLPRFSQLTRQWFPWPHERQPGCHSATLPQLNDREVLVAHQLQFLVR